MRLNRLTGLNWCQFPRFEGTIGRGLTAIIGNNGSGKSNLLGLIRWLLTGDNPNTGAKGDNVYQLAPPDERANGQLEFEHLGNQYQVTRHLRPESAKSLLSHQVDGQWVPIASGEKAVNQKLFEILGIDNKMINRFVLVAQDDIFGFLSEDKAEVDKFFQRLFDTTKADRCQEIVGKYINQQVVPSVGVELDQLRQELNQVQGLVQQHTLQLAAIPEIADYLQLQQADQQLVRDATQRNQLNNQLITDTVDVQRLLQQTQSRQLELTQLLEDLRVLREARDNGQASTDQARVSLANWQQFRALEQARQSIGTRRQAFQAAADANPEPALSPHEPEESTLAEAIANKRQELAVRQQAVTDFNGTGLAECPKCHTPVRDIQTYINECLQLLPQLQGDLLTLQDRAREIAHCRKLHQQWRQWQASWQASVDAIEAEAQRLQQTSMMQPDHTEQELQAIVTGHHEYVVAIQGLEPRVQQLQREAARDEGTLEAKRTQLMALQNQLNLLTATDEDAIAAQSRMQLRTQAVTERNAVAVEQARQEQRLQSVQQRLADLTRQDQEAAMQRAWVAQCGEWRSILKAVPRFVAQQNLQRLQITTNELLRMLEVDFQVVADEGLSFIANFYDGRQQIAKRLSGGQKVSLALAFRIAVNSTFAESIGVLALDEPTAYLDKHRIRALAPVLGRLQELSASRGLQCLIVTHEDELAPLFDGAIQL